MGGDDHQHRDHARQLNSALAGDLSALFGIDGTSSVAATDANSVAPVDSSSSVSYVFVTASPTFSGPAGGFVTLTPSNFLPSATTLADPATTASTPSTPSTTASIATIQQPPPSTPSPTTSATRATTKPATSVATSASTSTTANAAAAVPAAQTSAVSATAGPSSISGGAIAGIVICLLLVFGAAAAGGFYLYRLRRQKALDEKDPFADSAAAPVPPTSLRPITPPPPHQTEWMGSVPDSANLAPTGAVAAGGLAGGLAGTATRAPAQDVEKANPFGNHAAVDAQDSGIPAPLRINTPAGEAAAMAAGGAAAGLAGGAAAATAATRGPNSPAAFVGAAAGGAASGGRSSPAAAGAPANMVHRIQLDFKPSMDDELELRVGQLVRLLHEYDDGWALCIRLDRSQQGVAPRTCLSTRPVKPRQSPGTPPPMRLPMQGAAPRSQFPPALSPGEPKPSSPASFRSQPRSMSPGPYGGGPQQRPGMASAADRPRSNSNPNIKDLRSKVVGPSPMNPTASAAAATPPTIEARPTAPHDDVSPSSSRPQSPGILARKPVPGQAP